MRVGIGNSSLDWGDLCPLADDNRVVFEIYFLAERCLAEKMGVRKVGELSIILYLRNFFR